MKLTQYLDSLVRSELLKMTLSKPKDKSFAYKKTVIERKKKGFQASQYTDKQVFHLNFEKDVTDVLRRLADNYLNVNAVCADGEYVILINKKGNCVHEKDVMQRKLRNGHRSQQEEKLYTFAGRGH